MVSLPCFDIQKVKSLGHMGHDSMNQMQIAKFTQAYHALILNL